MRKLCCHKLVVSSYIYLRHNIAFFLFCLYIRYVIYFLFWRCLYIFTTFAIFSWLKVFLFAIFSFHFCQCNIIICHHTNYKKSDLCSKWYFGEILFVSCMNGHDFLQTVPVPLQSVPLSLLLWEKFFEKKNP